MSERLDCRREQAESQQDDVVVEQLVLEIIGSMSRFPVTAIDAFAQVDVRRRQARAYARSSEAAADEKVAVALVAKDRELAEIRKINAETKLVEAEAECKYEDALLKRAEALSKFRGWAEADPDLLTLSGITAAPRTRLNLDDAPQIGPVEWASPV